MRTARAARRRRLRDRRRQDLHHQRPPCRPGVRGREDRRRAAARKGVSLLMVETDDLPGFRRGRLLEKIGQHGHGYRRAVLRRACACRPSNLLGDEEGQGFMQLMQQLPRERLLIAVGAVGDDAARGRRDAGLRRAAPGVRRAAAGDAEHPLQAGRMRRPRRRSRRPSSTPASSASSPARSTCRPPRWPSGRRPTSCAAWSTNACSCTAATAT